MKQNCQPITSASTTHVCSMVAKWLLIIPANLANIFHIWLLCDGLLDRNGNFASFSSHPPQPTPIRIGMGA